MNRGRLAFISCNGALSLAERIEEELRGIYNKERMMSDFNIVQTQELRFANGEIKTIINDTVRGSDLYILQLMDDPLSSQSVNDNFIALVSAIDAAYQSDAEHITALIPQFPYSRQERRKGREGITAKLIARFLEQAGAERIVTIDVHAEAVAGFFDRKFENLHASRLIIDHFLTKYQLKDFMVVAPDVGSANRSRFFASTMGCDLAIIDKVRNYSKASTIEDMTLVGNCDKRDIFMADDMIATGGTILNACKLLKDNGAQDIFLAATFAFLNGTAVDKFDKAYSDGVIKKVIGTDAVFRGADFINEHPWYDEISIAGLFAQTIFNINKKRSLSPLFR